jgi:hypothetical protein
MGHKTVTKIMGHKTAIKIMGHKDSNQNYGT